MDKTLLILTFFLFYTCNAPLSDAHQAWLDEQNLNQEQQSKLPLKTFQTNCYNDAGSIISCIGTGQDAEYQSGRSINFSGPAAHSTYTSDFTTTDKHTNLIWKSCIEGLTGSTCTGTETISDWTTSQTSCSTLNNANSGNGYAGRTNWRLPTVNESLDLQKMVTPYYHQSTFPYLSQNIATSTEFAADTTNVFSPQASNGTLNTQLKVNAVFRTICVSGATPTPTVNLTDHGDGTVTDNNTTLVWQKCSMGTNNDATCSGTIATINWSGALNYCNNLTLSGKQWRLPNYKELESLLSDKTTNPIHNSILTWLPTSFNYYWTSTTYEVSKSSGLAINMGNARSAGSDKASTVYPVRCVATGP